MLKPPVSGAQVPKICVTGPIQVSKAKGLKEGIPENRFGPETNKM